MLIVMEITGAGFAVEAGEDEGTDEGTAVGVVDVARIVDDCDGVEVDVVVDDSVVLEDEFTKSRTRNPVSMLQDLLPSQVLPKGQQPVPQDSITPVRFVVLAVLFG